MRQRLNLALALSLSASALALAAPARAGDGLLVIESAQNGQAAAPSGASPAKDAAAQGSIVSTPAPSGATGLRLQTIDTDAGPDESALRYYASMNQKERVNIEIDRLKRLYPNWQPPQDLYDTAAPGGEDEGSLWDLFSANRLDELKAAIAQRMKDEPGWQPSADLTQKMQAKSLRMKILALAKSGQLKDIIDIVKADGYGGQDADVEVLWTVADAYARTKQPVEAQKIYRAILTNSTDHAQRIATIEKAMADLRMSDVEPLIAMGRAGTDGRSEFAAILVDIVRARIAAFLHDERKQQVDPAELQAFEAYARTAPDANQPGLVAWYFYKLKDYRNAFDWFKYALAHGGDAMVAHGLAITLQALGMERDTEEVAYAWRKPLVNNLVLYLDTVETQLTKPVPPYVEPERLARYARTVMETASGEGAQALAWYAYNSCQYDVAFEWFQRAVAWFPKEATVYGYALTAGKLKKKKEELEIINRYDGLFPKVVEILFPDGYYHSPSPCDDPEVMKRRPQPQPMGAFTVPGPAQMDPARVQAGVDPRNSAVQYGMDKPQEQRRLPKISRAEFPVATNPENPLRAPTLPQPGTAGAPVWHPGAPLGLRPEPAAGPYPLVARRVPGVGPMPYEQWGFSLLPGWNGIQTATWPPASAQNAPVGTLWAADHAVKPAPAAGGLPPSYGANAAFTPTAGANGFQQSLQPRFVPQPYGAPGQGGAWGQPGQFQTLDRRSELVGGKVVAALDYDPVGTIAPRPIGPTTRFHPFAESKPDWELRPSLDADSLRREAEESWHARDFKRALATLDVRAAETAETPDLKLIRGYALLQLHRRKEARDIFASLIDAPETAAAVPNDSQVSNLELRR